MASDALHDFLDSELRAWCAEFLQQRIAYLRSKKITGSEDLIRSLEYEVRKQAAAQLNEALIAFEDYGRIIEMRRIDTHSAGGDIITRLQEWIRAKGVESFKAGYIRRRKYLPRTNEKLIQSIAWGIAITRSGGKFRRRQWWNKPKSAAISDLFNRVAAGILDLVGGEISKQFPKTIQ